MDHVTSGRRCPLRRVISGEEGWPWEGELGRENFVCNSELRTVDHHVESLPSGRCPVISSSGEPGGMVGVKVAELHLVSMILQYGVKVGDVADVAPRTGGCRGDVYIDEGQCGSLEVSFDCHYFCHDIIRKYVIVRYPIGDGVVDESDKSFTDASSRVITPDSGVACELL